MWCAHTRARVLKEFATGRVSGRASELRNVGEDRSVYVLYVLCIMYYVLCIMYYVLYVAANDAVLLLDAGASTAAVHLLLLV